MVRFVLLSAFVAALTPSLRAQNPPPGPSQPVFRSEASMVAVNVTVLDGRKLVSGLSRDAFEVYEDGVQQQVKFFEAQNVPMDVILLLDTSSSMSDKMETVHQAARGFMKVLRPVDRGAIVTFADTVNVAQELTSDPVAIEAAINSTRAQGSTSLHNAIYVALKHFGKSTQASGEIRRQAIAVLSDGQDTASLISFDDVMALARKVGVNIYTIGLKSAYDEVRAESDRKIVSNADYSMRSLAQESGGLAFFPQSVHELKSVYDTIAGELSAQYSLGYSPTNARTDGRYRRIVVRLPSNPGFRPRARSGYTADGPRATLGLLINRK